MLDQLLDVRVDGLIGAFDGLVKDLSGRKTPGKIGHGDAVKDAVFRM